MNRLFLIVIFFAFALHGVAEKRPDYTNSRLPTERRVSDLMARMTTEEKVAQMCQYVGISHMMGAQQALSMQELEKSDASGFYPGYTVEDIREMTRKGLIGSFLHVVTAEEANYLQKLARQSRLKIPLFIAIDALHGNGLCKGATVYPTPIGQAATFSPALVEKMSRQTAVEMRACGMHWAFAPNVEVVRDLRWGRIGETFGEDPYLSGLMGSAAVRGLQTAKLEGNDKVLACVKHFVGGSLTSNGINGSPADMSERMLREVFLPPFRKCIDAGCATLMPSHNDLSGIPCHGNKWLLDDLLRKELGFRGIIVSDWLDVERLHSYHKVAPTKEEAYLMGLEAGIGVHMHGPGFAESVLKGIREGKVDIKTIDKRVAKILEMKFRLGLFENPFVDLKAISRKVFTPEHRQTALDMARR
ncbi:MAG: glycoside hydrolase family 3 protein, partial [Prevotella sp.]